jgi:hypothetical protein
MSYFFMLTSIGTALLIHHRLNVRGVDAARAIQRRARVAIPTAYIVVFLVEVACFFASGSNAARTAATGAVSEPAGTSTPARGLDR